MVIAVFGAKGRVGSKVVEIAEQRGHTVYPIDIPTVTTNNQNGSKVNLQVADEDWIDNIKKKNTDKKISRDKQEQILDEKKTDNTVNPIDVVIDFSTAAATDEVCEFCRLHRCPLVSGVTGRNAEQSQQIEQFAKELPVVTESNFSVGVKVLRRICEIVAKELADWDCEVVEIHRKGKLDTPSGTAKSLAVAVARQKSFKKVTVHSLRCGSNFGKHEVIFATNGESLTLTHQAENVEIFAKGAIIEAEKLIKQ